MIIVKMDWRLPRSQEESSAHPNFVGVDGGVDGFVGLGGTNDVDGSGFGGLGGLKVFGEKIEYRGAEILTH